MIRRPPISSLFPLPSLFLFFFNDTATTEIYTLSLHDALPICTRLARLPIRRRSGQPERNRGLRLTVLAGMQNGNEAVFRDVHRPPGWRTASLDRKSTRLNSSHTIISYAVFCLKKKKHTHELQS